MKVLGKLFLVGIVVTAVFASREAHAQFAPLSDFSRFAKATGQDVVIVDHDGAVLEGTLASATADDITMRFASGDRIFAKTVIASADRRRDSTRDGLVKGALFGTALALVLHNSGAKGAFTSRVVLTYAGIGWALDAANKNPQAIYRAATK